MFLIGQNLSKSTHTCTNSFVCFLVVKIHHIPSLSDSLPFLLVRGTGTMESNLQQLHGRQDPTTAVLQSTSGLTQ